MTFRSLIIITLVGISVLIFEKKEAKALFLANCWTKNAKGITCWLSDFTPKKALDSAMKKADKHCRNHKKISSVLYHKGNRVKFSCLTKEQYREKLATGIDPYAGEKNKSEKVDDFGKKYKKPMEQIIKAKKDRDREKKRKEEVAKNKKKIEENEKKIEENKKSGQKYKIVECSLTGQTRGPQRGTLLCNYTCEGYSVTEMKVASCPPSIETKIPDR